jgi:hypothetical protein
MKAYPFLPILINFDVFNKLSKRSWYKDAVAKQGGIVVTEPYKAKGNGHIVVTIAKQTEDVFNKLSKLKSSATTPFLSSVCFAIVTTICPFPFAYKAKGNGHIVVTIAKQTEDKNGVVALDLSLDNLLPILINFDVFNKLSKLKSSATTPFLSSVCFAIVTRL